MKWILFLLFVRIDSISKGRITVIYHDENYPQSINYTLDRIGDQLENKYENDLRTYGLDYLKKYQLIIHIKVNETLIITDIYCSKTNHCAYDEIENLSSKYKHQLNPLNELKTLIYTNENFDELVCYDSLSEQTIHCHDSNSICLSYSKDLKQECSNETNDIHLHEEFVTTYPEQIALNLMNEYLRCNRNHCNTIESLTDIQQISRTYVYGNGLQTRNVAYRQNRFEYHLFLILLFCVFIITKIF